MLTCYTYLLAQTILGLAAYCKEGGDFIASAMQKALDFQRNVSLYYKLFFLFDTLAAKPVSVLCRNVGLASMFAQSYRNE